jgi:hypothetical protein
VSKDVGAFWYVAWCLSILEAAESPNSPDGVPCPCGSDEKRDSKEDRVATDVVSSCLPGARVAPSDSFSGGASRA